MRAYHLGIVFDDQGMRRFVNTVLNVLWNQDEARPEFRSHLDFQYGSPIGNESLFRLLWLYEFEPRVGELINRHYVNHSDRAALRETCANLACWQARVLEDDYPQSPSPK